MTVRFVASEGPGSHGTLYAGDFKTTVKDRKQEIGKGLLTKMLADLEIGKEDFWNASSRAAIKQIEEQIHAGNLQLSR